MQNFAKVDAEARIILKFRLVDLPCISIYLGFNNIMIRLSIKTGSMEIVLFAKNFLAFEELYETRFL